MSRISICDFAIGSSYGPCRAYRFHYINKTSTKIVILSVEPNEDQRNLYMPCAIFFFFSSFIFLPCISVWCVNQAEWNVCALGWCERRIWEKIMRKRRIPVHVSNLISDDGPRALSLHERMKRNTYNICSQVNKWICVCCAYARWWNGNLRGICDFCFLVFTFLFT